MARKASDPHYSGDEEWSTESTESSINDDESQESETPSSQAKSCATCSKDQASLPKPLQRCSRCLTTHYCSVECQKTDWKIHKIFCKKPTTPSLSSGAAMFDTMLGSIDLDKLSKDECYTRLIDSYRMRVEDDYKFGGDAHGLYAEEDPRPEFRRFLTLAEKRGNILPKWWTQETKKACVAKGANRGKSNWADLSCAVEKSDIQEHYKDNMMPAKLRIMAEKVYGKPIAGLPR
ncbi:MAG: hypothetical protein Q9219_004320 [cf. Caloplaca sp. 3 TL-2023]